MTQGDYILKEEVEKAVTRMKKNKSPGVDEITSEMIKDGRHCLTDYFHHLCNLIWKEGKMPKEWTKSVLITIPKKGNATECSNYHIITFLSHIGKLMMTILTRRLQGQVEGRLAFGKTGVQILALRLIAEMAKRKGLQSTTASWTSKKPSTP